MARKNFYRTLIWISIISGLAFLFSVYRVDPRGGVLGIGVFLTSLFFFISSITTVLLFTIVNRARNNEAIHHTASTSTRRGSLIGIYTIIALALSALELLTWWDAILLAFSLVLFELYFMSGKEKSL